MLIEIILPLSLLLALGYSCIRFEILSPALLPHLSQFVIKISLPAFLVVAKTRPKVMIAQSEV